MIARPKPLALLFRFGGASHRYERLVPGEARGKKVLLVKDTHHDGDEIKGRLRDT